MHANPCCGLSGFVFVFFLARCFPTYMLFELRGSKAEVSMLPNGAKNTNDFSIIYVNWWVAITPATITHLAHTQVAHMPADTLEIKIPGY